MNNYMYHFPQNPIQQVLEELRKINEHLNKIENQVNEITKKEKNKYLEKDDNYYII